MVAQLQQGTNLSVRVVESQFATSKIHVENKKWGFPEMEMISGHPDFRKCPNESVKDEFLYQDQRIDSRE